MEVEVDVIRQEELYDDIYRIAHIDPLNSNVEFDQLQNAFIDAQKIIQHLKNKIDMNTTNNTNEIIVKEDDTSTSSTNSIENLQIKELKESISKKNLYIKEILTDIKAFEEENVILKQQIQNLKSKLSEATTHIQNFNIYFKNIQTENINLTAKNEELEKGQKALQIQITEVNEVNKMQENQIEDFVEQMNMKLSEWKNIIDTKTVKIKLLNEEINDQNRKLSVYEKNDPYVIDQIVKDRNNQIEDLTNMLCEATKNIEHLLNNNEKLKKEIVNYKSEEINFKLISKEVVDDNVDYSSINKTLIKYQDKIKHLEKCLLKREKEIVETRKIDMSDNEENLTSNDRSQKYSKIIKQLDIRDKQILSLIAENNKSNHIIHQLQTENSIMREKLNIKNDEITFDIPYTLEKEKYDEKYSDLYQRLSSASEENILLQIRLRQKEKNIRKLHKHLNDIGIKLPQSFISVVLSESSPYTQTFEENNNNIRLQKSEDKSEIIQNPDVMKDNENFKDDNYTMKESHQQLIDENEGLRKCFHEILDAIKNKTFDSSCEIDLSAAESLLNAMDSRHVAGWYHPAMRMLMQLNYEKGFQSSLRTMLKDARSEIASTLDLLSQEKKRNIFLEQKLKENKNVIHNENIIDSNKNVSENTEKCVENKNDIIDIDLKIINNANLSYEKIIHKNLQHFHSQYQLLYDNMMEVFSQSNTDKMKWIFTENSYKYEIENLSSLLESMKIRLNEVEKLKMPLVVSDNLTSFVSAKSLIINENEIKNDSIQSNIQNKFPDIKEILSSLEKVDPVKFLKIKSFIELYLTTIEKNSYFERKNEYVELSLKNSQNEKDKILRDFNEFKINHLINNKTYEVKIQNLLFEIADLRKELKNSIPLSEFLKLNEKFSNISMKYRKFLNNFNLNEKLWNNTDEKNDQKVSCDDLNNLNNQFEPQKSENVKEFQDRIKFLENKNLDLQDQQNILLNTMQTLWLEGDHQMDIQNVISSKKDKEELEIKVIELNSKISILEEKLAFIQKTKSMNDMEVNILKHQILDLQSANDDKAIIARLNTEILISHINIANMNEKEETLLRNYENEHNIRMTLEKILLEKDEDFKKYIIKTNEKLSFLNSLLQTMREQYQGAVPLMSLEMLKDFRLKFIDKEVTQNEENILFQKKYFEFLEDNKLENKNIHSCTASDKVKCQHYIEMKKNEYKAKLNILSLSSKLKRTEEQNKELFEKFDQLNNTLLQLTFSFGEIPNDIKSENSYNIDVLDHPYSLKLDIIETPVPRPRSKKISPKIIPESVHEIKSPVSKLSEENIILKSVAETQTDVSICLINAFSQTDAYSENIEHLKILNMKLLKEKEIVQYNKNQCMSLASERAAEILKLQTENSIMKYKIENLQNTLEKNSENFTSKKDLSLVDKEKSKAPDDTQIDTLKIILENMKKIEEEKENTIKKYKDLLYAEKSSHLDTKKLAGKQIYDLKEEIENLEKECDEVKKMFKNITHDGMREKNNSRLLELEEHCFQLQTDIDNNHSSMTLLKSECKRWKDLAIERFSKMEILKKQIEEKHIEEVVSYKSEAAHWLSELSSTKNELSDMKIQLGDLRTSSIQQLSEKHHIIENLQLSNIYLQQQLSNVLSMISEEDSFDISQLIEISDQNNQVLKEKIETASIKSKNQISKGLKTQSVCDESFQNISIQVQMNNIKKEKHMLSKQNEILRKQIQILTEREKRLRYEHQNMKPQIQNKLQVLNNSNKFRNYREDNIIKEHRDSDKMLTETSLKENDVKMKYIDLWNKQKRWQEISEHWKQKFQNKCSEYEQLKRNFESSKNIINHFEKEKRSTESRMSKNSKLSDGISPSTVTGESDSHLEMLLQDKERLENEVKLLQSKLGANLTHNSLMERLEAQQRKISAFELSERGKDIIVNEYETLLAQNTILSKKVIKLESELLEKQLGGEKLIKSKAFENNDCCIKLQQKNDHLERYLKLLKEENSQLIAKNIEYDSAITLKSKGSIEQVNKKTDLERTILTLRGIINKLQSEIRQMKNDNLQKSTSQYCENKLIIELSHEKNRLNGIIKDKDELLNRAKELLRKAADNEKQLLKQIKILKEHKPEKLEVNDYSRFKEF